MSFDQVERLKAVCQILFQPIDVDFRAFKAVD